MTMVHEIIDPKLARALDEIDAVLNKHEIAGHICLASSTHAAFRFTLPKWSAVQVDSGKARVKLTAGEHELAASSMHLILGLRDLSVMRAKVMIDLGELLEKKLKEAGIEVEHEFFGGDDTEAGAAEQ